MTCQSFVHSLLAAALLAGVPLCAQQRGDAYASIAQLQQRMDAGTLASQALTQQFLAWPAGWAHGLPAGRLLSGTPWSKPTLIGAAYGFEQHTHARQPPEFLDTVGGKPVPPGH